MRPSYTAREAADCVARPEGTHDLYTSRYRSDRPASNISISSPSCVKAPWSRSNCRVYALHCNLVVLRASPPRCISTRKPGLAMIFDQSRKLPHTTHCATCCSAPYTLRASPEIQNMVLRARDCLSLQRSNTERFNRSFQKLKCLAIGVSTAYLSSKPQFLVCCQLLRTHSTTRANED